MFSFIHRKQKYDVVTVGSSLRDIAFITDQMQMIDNPAPDPLREKLFAVESGAKIKSQDVTFGFGGGAGNTAVNFSTLGFRTGILSAIGKDEEGKAILRQYESAGVDTSLMQYSEQSQTGLSFIIVSTQTHDRTMFVSYGATEELDIQRKDLLQIKTDWYYVSSLNSPRWPQIVKALQATNARFAWNPGSTQLQASAKVLRPLIEKTDVLLLNADEATELLIRFGGDARVYSLEELVTGVSALGSDIVVVTDGKEGAIAKRGDEIVYHGVPHDAPVDVSGAGDCFGSSFVTGLIRYNEDMARSLDLAQTVVNGLIKKVGAQNGFTPWDMLPKRFRS